MAAPLRTERGFTLIELLVALTVMALLALLSWRGIDGMVRVQADMRERMDGVVGLQIGLTQWSTDLDAVVETGQVSGVDYDGRVLRLTRRDATVADSPVRVVGWARRVIDGQHGSRGSWARWQSPPLRTKAELQEAWTRVQLWAQNASDVEKRREVAVLGLEQWQVFYYRNNAWSNPLSTASAANTNTPTDAAASTAPTRSILAPLPDGIRLVLTLSPGQALTNVLTKDWIRPVLGGGKS
ncbi:MAG TPA: prepilin-type N-terminal cleavage/methylation domain-containing protein [Polaromonas sp.]|nr:prepilin-type N-terminal cleavage/methylation domain-containing protein [Polaromonas sp.]